MAGSSSNANDAGQAAAVPTYYGLSSSDHHQQQANSNQQQQPQQTDLSLSSLSSKSVSQYANVISHPTQQCLLQCYIPPSRVGAVIGRRGNTILHIQREAMKKSWSNNGGSNGGGVRLSVLSAGSASAGGEEKESQSDDGNGNSNMNNAKDNDEDETKKDPKQEAGENSNNNNSAAGENDIKDEDLWTPVMIRGDPSGVFAAAKLLVPLLHTGPPTAEDGNTNTNSHSNSNSNSHNSNNDNSNNHHYNPQADGDSEMDDVVLDIPIHRSKHSAIIGKKGMTIANLSADHNVRIMVPHRKASGYGHGNGSNNNNSHEDINVVQLEGELHNVEKCLVHMLHLVCSPPVGTTSTSSANGNDQDRDAEVVDRTSGSDDPDRIKSVEGYGNSNSNKMEINDVTAKDVATSIEEEVEGKITISIAVTSKKESKFTEHTITVPSELSSNVPSLGRIRIIGKSTNTVIRRKKTPLEHQKDDIGHGGENSEGGATVGTEEGHAGDDAEDDGGEESGPDEVDNAEAEDILEETDAIASLTLEEDGEEEVDAGAGAKADGNTRTLDETKKEQEDEPSSIASPSSSAASPSHLQALFTTQIIISGKTEPVRRATEQLQKILMPSSSKSGPKSRRNDGNGNIKHGNDASHEDDADANDPDGEGGESGTGSGNNKSFRSRGGKNSKKARWPHRTKRRGRGSRGRGSGAAADGRGSGGGGAPSDGK